MAMTTALIGGAVVTAGFGLVVAGTSAFTYRKYKKRAALKGNELFGVPLMEVDAAFLVYNDMPRIIDLCCAEFELRESSTDINWISLFQSADGPAVETNENLVAIVGQFSTPKSKVQKKIELNDLITQDVLNIFLYYLINIPEPLFLFETFNEFAELTALYKQDNSFNSWSSSAVDLLFKIPPRHRVTALRIFSSFNVIVNNIKDDVERDALLSILCLKLLQSFLAPSDPDAADIEKLADFGPNCLAMLIKNYGAIASACAHRNLTSF